MRFEAKALDDLSTASVDLFKRSFLVASFLPLCALALGYTDFKLLQDLYHVGLLYDFSLNPGELTYGLFQALEKERPAPVRERASHARSRPARLTCRQP